MLVTTPPAGAQPHGRTTKPGSPRGCGDRAGRGGARRQGRPRVPGPRDPRKERLGSYRDPNPASPARRLIQASRCQPPPGLAMGKPNRFCLGAEISGGLAFFQTSPANFTELPPLGMEAGRNSSVGRELEPGGGHSCCFCSLCVCVLLFIALEKEPLKEGSLHHTRSVCAVISVSERKRPASEDRAVNEPTQGEWRFYSWQYWRLGGCARVGVCYAQSSPPKLHSQARLQRVRDGIHKYHPL